MVENKCCTKYFSIFIIWRVMCSNSCTRLCVCYFMFISFIRVLGEKRHWIAASSSWRTWHYTSQTKYTKSQTGRQTDICTQMHSGWSSKTRITPTKREKEKRWQQSTVAQAWRNSVFCVKHANVYVGCYCVATLNWK